MRESQAVEANQRHLLGQLIDGRVRTARTEMP